MPLEFRRRQQQKQDRISSEYTSNSIVDGIVNLHESVFNTISGILSSLLDRLPIEPNIFREMTYEAAISYFVNERPSDPRVKKGAMVLQSHTKGKLFIQFFLDAENQIVCSSKGNPFGRQVIVQKIDEELLETFGQENLVIIE